MAGDPIAPNTAAVVPNVGELTAVPVLPPMLPESAIVVGPASVLFHQIVGARLLMTVSIALCDIAFPALKMAAMLVAAKPS